MAYDIQGIVDPKEVEFIKNLNTNLNESTASLIKFLEKQSQYKKLIDEAAASTDNTNKKTNEYAKLLNKAADDQNKLTATAKDLETQQKQLTQTEAKLLTVNSEANKTLVKSQQEYQKSAAEIKLKIKAQQAEKGSIDQLSAVNSILEKRLKAVNLTTEEGRKKADLLRSAIDKNNVKIKENSSALSAQKINIGNYGSAFSNLITQFKNGEISSKQLATGIIGIGKAMAKAILMNPILLAIAAIIGAIVGLVKVFKSTDEGATAFAGVMKALGNIIDVLVDRLVSFGKLLFDIITLDFKGMKENAVDAFGGIGKAIGDAARAGWEYAQVLDAIEDRESASLTRAAKLRKEIEELTVASKNRNLGSTEQIRLAELAMKKSKELSELEVGFSKQKTEAEKNNLASLIEGDNLTVKSKQELLEEWLKIDDLQLQSELEKNKQFANFYNKNEKDFQKLQKLRAGDVDNETSLVTETRRLQTSLFTFKVDLRRDEEASLKESQERKIKDAENLSQKELNEVTKTQTAKIGIDEKYFSEDTKKQLAFLTRKLEIYKGNEDETLKIQTDIDNLKLKESEAIQKKGLDLWKKQLEAWKNIEDEKKKKAEETAKEQAKIDQLYIEAAIADKQRQYEMEVAIIEATAKNETDKREKIHVLNQKTIDEEIQNAQDMLQFLDLTSEEEIYWIEKIKDLKHEAALAEMEDDTKTAEEKKKKILEYMDAVKSIGSALFAFSINKTQGELTALEDKNKKGLISDQEYAKQKSKLELKQAKQQKMQALFEIAINTASAIVQALPNVALAIMAGVLGAIQAATVLATPLPVALAKGSKNAPKEFIAGEAGRELVTLKTGEVLMANKATLFSGNKFKGATVFSNPETEKIMSSTEHKGFGAVSFSDSKLLKKLDSVEKAIKNKKEWILDNEYRVIGDQTPTQRNIYLNRLKYGR